MPLNPKSLRLIEHRDFPDEVVLDGGPARSKELDRRCFDTLERVLGGVSAVRRLAQTNGVEFGQFLEADWAATDRRFLYINYNAGSTSSWEWKDIASTAAVGSSLFGAGRRVRLSPKEGSAYDISIGRQATASLLKIASERCCDPI